MNTGHPPSGASPSGVNTRTLNLPRDISLVLPTFRGVEPPMTGGPNRMAGSQGIWWHEGPHKVVALWCATYSGSNFGRKSGWIGCHCLRSVVSDILTVGPKGVKRYVFSHLGECNL